MTLSANKKKITILHIIGTRPEAIKMAPIIHECQRHPQKINSVVCVTGQHREMLDQVLTLFKLRPDFDLRIMQKDQGLAELTGRLITHLNPLIKSTKPEWILAQGDTTTVLVAALLSFYEGIKFGHVEAGLRTGDRMNPFPEEINRKIADQLASIYFAPTENNRQKLLQEHVPKEKIFVTGNTVVDALLRVKKLHYNWHSGPLKDVPIDQKLVTITAHRRENFGRQLNHICLAIKELCHLYNQQGVHFVYPVHLNPQVKKPVYTILSNIPNLHLIPPLDYLSLVNLMNRSEVILTDSGGIQEEAPSLGIPVLVMRSKTERTEGLKAGAIALIGTDQQDIITNASRLLNNPIELQRMKKITNPYGDGKSAQRIIRIILKESPHII